MCISLLLVHLPQVNRGEVDLECALITEGLETDVALHPLLSRRRTHVRDADVVAQLLLQLLHRAAAAPAASLARVLCRVAALLARHGGDGRLDSVGRCGRRRRGGDRGGRRRRVEEAPAALVVREVRGGERVAAVGTAAVAAAASAAREVERVTLVVAVNLKKRKPRLTRSSLTKKV